MTTGADHYREAERLLDEMDYNSATDNLVAAQVHATLALAAATICAGNARTEIRDDGSTVTDVAQGAAWLEVLS